MKQVIGFCAIIIFFLGTSIFSLYSIVELQGDARVVNYTGIVRGATQKLIKEELMGRQDDALIARLDSIITELITGKGPYNLVVLPDNEYLGHLILIRQSWDLLKKQIMQVRAGADPTDLFDSSQSYFNLANDTVNLAENFSEKRVNSSITTLIVVNGIFFLFVVLSLIYFIRSIAVKKRADTLSKIAYVDPLTQIDNRASCERKIAAIRQFPPESVAAVMFDMNNLKLVNDFLGHQDGDRIISDFARVVKKELPENGFAGRYGGDEFLGIFENAADTEIEDYLAKVREQITAYNNLYTSEIQKISFAAGYAIGDPRTIPIDYLINEADKRMYANKRIMKLG